MKSINDKKVNRPLGFRILKYFFAAIGMSFIMVIVLITWVYFTLISGPGAMEINDFHPFRSPGARDKFFAMEDSMSKNWPVKSKERLVQTSFGKTFMRISGPAGAPPLVLLPGGGTSSLIWHANIKALSKNYRTYALDNIYDYGRSVYMRELKSGKDFSDWLNELFDTLKLGNNIRIIGYSYGGWVAARYVLDHPERISQAVLIAPVFFTSPLPDEYIRKMVLTLIPVRYFKSSIMYYAWPALAGMGDYGHQLVEERIDYYNLAMKSFKFKKPVDPVVFTDSDLKSMKPPVLYLAGNLETAFNAGMAVSRLNRVSPKIKTALVPGTGHDLLFTHADFVNSRVLEFLVK